MRLFLRTLATSGVLAVVGLAGPGLSEAQAHGPRFGCGPAGVWANRARFACPSPPWMCSPQVGPCLACRPSALDFPPIGPVAFASGQDGLGGFGEMILPGSPLPPSYGTYREMVTIYPAPRVLTGSFSWGPEFGPALASPQGTDVFAGPQEPGAFASPQYPDLAPYPAPPPSKLPPAEAPPVSPAPSKQAPSKQFPSMQVPGKQAPSKQAPGAFEAPGPEVVPDGPGTTLIPSPLEGTDAAPPPPMAPEGLPAQPTSLFSAI